MTVARSERVGSLHARVYSPASGTPKGAVVLVHGICTSSRVFRHWGPALAERGIEAWCVDLRGHGESDGRDKVGSARIADYADDIEAVLAASSSNVVVGHDMGALAGQVVATRQPLRGLVLVASVAPKGISGASNVSLLWRELRPRYVRALFRGNAWQPAPADASHLLGSKLDAAILGEVMGWLGPESGVAAREMVISGVPIDETRIACPALVAATTFDPLTPPTRQRQIAQKIRADYVEFAMHAHFPMLEPGWERPIAVIGRWLEEAARIGDTNRASLRRLRSAGDSPLPTGSTPTPTPTPSPAKAIVTPVPSSAVRPSSRGSEIVAQAAPSEKKPTDGDAASVKARRG
jgi:pimeloyl-ACP methyl ester carboxylesterase